jgi:predicted metalloendopeptidase
LILSLKINGINTLGENIADNSGVKEAFKAYKAYIRNHKAEQMLPGLKYRPDQLFWLSYSNVCLI